MDPRSIKRPRSSTPTISDTPQKKKLKSSKKNKNKKKIQLPEAPSITTKTKQSISSLDETATAEGQMMSQMLSTFSSIEQSRFEAYKRAKLNHNVVEDWVAACLSHHLSLEGPGRPLEDLVVPGCQREIGIVVATAAKIYAQRLVTTAVKLDRRVGPLPPEQIWKALQERRRSGLDPGFYLDKNETIQWRAPTSRQDYDQRRLAGLAAQEAYDEQFGVGAEEQEDEHQSENNDEKLIEIKNHPDKDDTIMDDS